MKLSGNIMNVDKITSPKVSVIIPIFNGEKYLKECLQSIENQSVANWEVICIDDGSTDHLEEVVRPWLQNKQPFSIEFYRKEGKIWLIFET